jgi:hypothetical protein
LHAVICSACLLLSGERFAIIADGSSSHTVQDAIDCRGVLHITQGHGMRTNQFGGPHWVLATSNYNSRLEVLNSAKKLIPIQPNSSRHCGRSTRSSWWTAQVESTSLSSTKPLQRCSANGQPSIKMVPFCFGFSISPSHPPHPIN